MSAWHDPRGRLIVDGEGRTVGRWNGDRVASHQPDASRSALTLWNLIQHQQICWHVCECGGHIPALKTWLWQPVDPPYAMVRHSCRPERHQ